MSDKREKFDPASINQEFANKVYNEVGEKVCLLLEKKGYLKDINSLFTSCCCLVTLAADLMAEATDMPHSVIIKELSTVLSGTLGYEVNYEIEEDDTNTEVNNEEEYDVMSLPKINDSKKMLN